MIWYYIPHVPRPFRALREKQTEKSVVCFPVYQNKFLRFLTVALAKRTYPAKKMAEYEDSPPLLTIHVLKRYPFLFPYAWVFLMKMLFSRSFSVIASAVKLLSNVKESELNSPVK